MVRQEWSEQTNQPNVKNKRSLGGNKQAAQTDTRTHLLYNNTVHRQAARYQTDREAVNIEIINKILKYYIIYTYI